MYAMNGEKLYVTKQDYERLCKYIGAASAGDALAYVTEPRITNAKVIIVFMVISRYRSQ